MNGRKAKQCRRLAILLIADSKNKEVSQTTKYGRHKATGSIVCVNCTRAVIKAVKTQQTMKETTGTKYVASRFSKTMEIWKKGYNKKNKRKK